MLCEFGALRVVHKSPDSRKKHQGYQQNRKYPVKDLCCFHVLVGFSFE
jgi:hypothetical protein